MKLFKRSTIIVPDAHSDSYSPRRSGTLRKIATICHTRNVFCYTARTQHGAVLIVETVYLHRYNLGVVKV